MRKFTRSVVATIMIAMAGGNSLADHGRSARPPYHHYDGHGGGGLDWLGAILLLGFTAAILDAATSSPAAPPPQKYVVPLPVQPAPRYIEQPEATGMWYFCRSAWQYYPYVRSCPEAWEQVPASPR
jgi:hypothetical protein